MGTYVGELDSQNKACGFGTWTRPDNMIWVGLYKNDGGHGRITFYDSEGIIYNQEYEDGVCTISSNPVTGKGAWYGTGNQHNK